jgi:uncharacterized membrane protein
VISEHSVHRAFQISVILKGIDAAIETLAGVALYFIGTDAITALVRRLTFHELTEDPNDFIASHLLHAAENFSVGSKTFYAFYLTSHGVLKLALVAGLLRGKLWSYPASLVVLGLFIVYQVYRFAFTHDPGLVALTVLDIVVIGLVWHEYRLVRRHLPLQ